MSKSKSKRLDAYVRVSRVGGREGETFISPELQEKRIRAWAVAQGHEIVAAHHELDVSGGTMDRPKFNEVLQRIDDGETQGVVVFNLSRFARTMVGSIEIVHRINERGALFASVSDGFDTTTVTGRMVMAILLAFAAGERERQQEIFYTSRKEAFERGWHLSSVPPFGYTRATLPDARTGGERPTGPLLVDPVNGPAVTGVFERRAAGEPWSRIRDWLAAEGIRTFNGGERFSNAALLAIVRNRVYLGIATGGSDIGSRPDAHIPLVDEPTWHAAQDRRLPRASSPADGGMVARGLVRCAGCRYIMALGRYGDRTAASWQCGNHARGQPCPTSARIVAARPGRFGLDDYVVEQLWEQDEFRDITVDEIDTAQDEAIELVAVWRDRQERHAVNFTLEEAIGAAAYNMRGEVIERELAAAETVLAKLQQRLGANRRHRRRLREDWPDMSLEDRRAEACAMVQAIFVRAPQPGVKEIGRVRDPEADRVSRRRYFASRIHIVWVDDDPVDVPRQGRRPFHPEKRPNGYRARPFVFPDADPD